ncbi:MAG: protein translocase subunit SecF [Clostridiales bacterium]|jgi:preprotein translocase subunit SecF|nr:protein translocase subunit SecF [Clostridiales bacterium]
MNINFVKNAKKYALVSVCIIIVGLLVNIIFGVELDIEFKGGTLLKYDYAGTLDDNEVTDFISNQLGVKADVQLSTNDLVEGFNTMNVSCTSDITLEQNNALTAALEEKYPDGQFKLTNSQSLKPSMGQLFFVKCLVAIALASVLLVVYVALRFRKIGGWTAGIMAVLALLNDVLVAYFVFVIFRIPLNENFVAVVLSILGYSLNATIVVYDRIRENRQKMDSKTPIADIVNLSVNQSFTRTLNTSICTFAAIATVAVVGLIFNLDSITSFALPMMFGVASGFYTSVFLSSPLWARWQQHRIDKAQKNKPVSKKKKAKA